MTSWAEVVQLEQSYIQLLYVMLFEAKKIVFKKVLYVETFTVSFNFGLLTDSCLLTLKYKINILIWKCRHIL